MIRSHEGALIVIGHPDELSFLYSGGIRIDQPFTPQLLYELAKMDGAIVVDESLSRIAYANVQLMPDPTIPSAETGTRHRTAERVAKQTGVLVVSISQQRETVTIFIGPARYQLDPTFSVFAKANQGLAALETYRRRLDQVLTRLTALEFQGAAVLDDVLVVVQRGEMTARMVREVERDIVELGTEGRLIRARLDELSSQLLEELAPWSPTTTRATPRRMPSTRSSSSRRFPTSCCSSRRRLPRHSGTRAESTRSTRPSARAASVPCRTSRGCHPR